MENDDATPVLNISLRGQLRRQDLPNTICKGRKQALLELQIEGAMCRVQCFGEASENEPHRSPATGNVESKIHSAEATLPWGSRATSAGRFLETEPLSAEHPWQSFQAFLTMHDGLGCFHTAGLLSVPHFQ